VAGSRSRDRRGKLIPFAGFAALFPEAIDFAGLVIGRFIGKLTAPMSVGFASRTLPIARFRRRVIGRSICSGPALGCGLG